MEPGRNGFLFNPAMAESIAGAILAFCHLPAGRRVAMGVESRRMAELLFAPERAAAAYAELLEAALAATNRGEALAVPSCRCRLINEGARPCFFTVRGTLRLQVCNFAAASLGPVSGQGLRTIANAHVSAPLRELWAQLSFSDREATTRIVRYVGDDLHLGRRPTLQAVHSKILIGNKVIFGPEVAIHGGNHTSTLLGRYIHDVREKEKRPEDDADVVIEDDVWVGTRAIILKGVTIHRGAIIGAGAAVTRDVPPYAIAAGVPARVVRFRWTPEMILRHEALLYPAERRLARKAIEEEARRCGWLNK